LIKTALQYILGMAEPKPLELEGRPYTTAKVFPVETPLPELMIVHTLTGIRDYLVENPDGLDLDHVLVHVFSPSVVRVKSTLIPPFVDRGVYLDATYDQPIFKFGQYMDIETFIVELQAKFVQDEMTATILQLAGNLTDEQIQTYADDGITQAVNTKNGIGRAEMRAVPNPVMLSPYRTFNEIAQPVGRFVLRMKSGTGTSNGRPAVALFEADGGAWQQDAILFIRTWLQECLPTEVVVIA